MTRELLEDQIYSYLCAQLSSHKLLVGAHLKAGEIAADLDVSRTSVRKAIIRLVDDGCVQLNSGGRPIVVSLPKKRKQQAETVFAYANQTEQAYWTIFDAIFEGKLRQGQNVNGQELAAEIGVSLGTVRQALDWLCRDGLLLRLPRRGWKVVYLAVSDLADAFQIRALLEPLALSRVIERMPAEQLRELIADNERVLRDDGQLLEDERRRIDYRFHRTLLEASDSPILLETVEPLLRKCMLVGVGYQIPTNVIHESFQEHIEIAQALLDKNLPLACDVLRKHVTRSNSLYGKLFQEQGVPGAERTSADQNSANQNGTAAAAT